MSNEVPAIEMRGVGFRYDGRRVISDFSLRVARGEKVTLTGPSGSGKSTVLKSVLGLVVPQSGSISILGREINGHDVWAARRSLAYVAQEPELGTGTAGEAIERPFAFKANAALRVNLDRLPALLERFGLSRTLLDKEASTLSGGEKQRIAVVSAILLDRPIILLDEASSALDRNNKQRLADYFRQASNLTVLSVSHDTEWQGFSSRVVDMADHAHAEGAQT